MFLQLGVLGTKTTGLGGTGLGGGLGTGLNTGLGGTGLNLGTGVHKQS